MTTLKERKLLFTLGALQFTNVLDFMIMAPLAPQLMRSFDITTQEFGFLLSSYTISAGISGFISAFYADKFDRKLLIKWVYIGFLIGTLLCGLANSYYLLLFARLFTGAFGGTIGATAFAIIGDIIPAERRGQAMGIVMTSFAVASVVGIPLGLELATLSDTVGWHAPFLAIVLLGLPIVWAINTFIPAINAHLTSRLISVSPLKILTSIASNRSQMTAISLMTLMMFGQFMLVPFISPSMVFNVGIPENQLSKVYFFGGLATIFSGPAIGKLSDMYGKKLIFVIMAILSLIPIYFISHMPATLIWIALSATTAFFVFSSGRGIVASAIVTGTVSPAQRGSFMSISGSVQQLAAGLATLVGGSIVTRSATGHLDHLEIVGYVSMIATLVSLALVPYISSFVGQSDVTVPSSETALSAE